MLATPVEVRLHGRNNEQESSPYTTRSTFTDTTEDEDEDDDNPDNMASFRSYHSRARWSSEINSFYNDDEDLLGLHHMQFDLESPRQTRKRRRTADRRVRFNDGLRITAIEDFSSDDDAPFVRQDKLSAQLKKMIDNDDDNDDDAFWKLAADVEMEEDDESGSSSGYESALWIPQYFVLLTK
jgi:hypothetical protein